MSETRKYKITAQQGQILLQQAALVPYPAKLGTEEINIGERAVAGDELRELYRELKSWSPAYLKSKDKIRFGTLDNWEEREEPDEKGIPRLGWHLKNLDLVTEIRLDEDAHMGVFRVLFVLLHPGTERRASTSLAEDYLWPLAEELRLVKMLKDALPKGTKRRLELDAEVKTETSPAETETEPAEAKKEN